MSDVRVRIYLSGRVLMTDAVTGAVIKDFVVPDPRKAQEIAMAVMEELKAKEAKLDE